MFNQPHRQHVRKTIPVVYKIRYCYIFNHFLVNKLLATEFLQKRIILVRNRDIISYLFFINYRSHISFTKATSAERLTVKNLSFLFLYKLVN